MEALSCYTCGLRDSRTEAGALQCQDCKALGRSLAPLCNACDRPMHYTPDRKWFCVNQHPED